MHNNVLLAAMLISGGANLPLTALAQNDVTVVYNDGKETRNSISGIILDEDNQPLIGAQVKVANQNVATITDVNGRFNNKNGSIEQAKTYCILHWHDHSDRCCWS